MRNKTLTKLYATIDDNETLIILILVCLTILLRLLTTTPIEDKGDSVFYWEAAKKLYYGIPFSPLTHWNTRFGIIIPAFMSINILGPGPIAYFIPTIIMSVLCSIFLYLIALRTSSRSVALITTGLFILYPQMVRNGSQLLLGIYSSAYMLIAVWFLVRYLQKKNTFSIDLILSAVFLFIAYLTKITNLFFLPGIIIAIFYVKKSYRPCTAYCLLLLGLFITETLLYSRYFNIPLGRIGVIWASHVHGNIYLNADSAWTLLYRYIHPGPHFTILFAGYLYSCYKIIRNNKNIIKAIAFISFSFFFLLTFSIKSISPFQQLINNQIRYLLVGQPLMFLVLFDYTASHLKSRGYYRQFIQAMSIVLIISLCVYAVLFRHNITSHEYIKAGHLYRQINTLFNNGEALCYPIPDAVAWIKGEQVLNKTSEMNEKTKKIRGKYIKIFKNINLIRTNYLENLYTMEDIVDLVTYQNTPLLILRNKNFPETIKRNLSSDKGSIHLIERRPLKIIEMLPSDFLLIK